MSQAQQILDHLRSGKTLTPVEALNRFACWRLSGRIKELREAGYRIRTQMVRLASGKRIGMYRMNA